LLAFAFFALLAGLLAKAYAPEAGKTRGGYFQLFFSDPIHMKAWLASVAVALAIFQHFTAAWIFHKLPWAKPAWVNPVHRWSGRLAFVVTLPIAYDCIFKLGLQSGESRVLWHSLLGCAFYSAFAAKILIVGLRRFSTAVLPAAGGLVFVILVGVWYTSALWFFRLVGVQI
jgi:hypothetical protein